MSLNLDPYKKLMGVLSVLNEILTTLTIWVQ